MWAAAYQTWPDRQRGGRIPAPELSFSEPNLPFLIQEIDKLP